jgi:dUTP pyrophosphatase
MVKLGIRNTSTNPLPEYKTPGSSGMDVRAFLEDSETLYPGQRKLIHTGIYLDIPENYEVQVRSRSGQALKQGLIVLNEPGTIDSDYTGEVGVILYNASSEPQVVEPGNRIAQLVLSKVEKAELEELKEINKNTSRGSGGYGSTGKN